MSKRTCSIHGCEKRVHGQGLCSPHWNRQRRYGDPHGSKPRPIGSRIKVIIPGHPLAGVRNQVRRARVVLYAVLGGQDAPCHWCGRPLRWLSGKDARGAPGCLCADHLDGDTQNDSPENLVPACLGCNANRHRLTFSAATACSIGGCDQPHKALGLCRKHYLRQYKDKLAEA